MNYRIARFDDLRAAAPERYTGPSAPPATSLERRGLVIADTPDDHMVLDDATIVNGGGVAWRDHWIVDDLHYMPLNWKVAPWLPGQIDAAGETIYLRDDSLTTDHVVDGPVMLLDSMACGNFGHFIHDMAAYGWLFRQLRRQIDGLRPLVPPLRYPNQISLFEQIFDIAIGDCVTMTGTTRARELHIFRRQTDFNDGPWRMSHRGMREAARRVRERWGAPEGTWRPDIYVHRTLDLSATALMQGRDFTNVPELAVQMMDRGYIGLEVGRVGVEAVGWALSRARYVVGIHGAGLANMLFCPPGCHVFEIIPIRGAWRSLEGLALVLGLSHHTIGHQPPAEGERPQLDIPQLLERIALVEAADLVPETT